MESESFLRVVNTFGSTEGMKRVRCPSVLQLGYARKGSLAESKSEEVRWLKIVSKDWWTWCFFEVLQILFVSYEIYALLYSDVDIIIYQILGTKHFTRY